jgi:hypothetical protein
VTDIESIIHKPRIRMKCSACGSTDVRRNADCTWNELSQEWEICALFDSADCEKCEGECHIESEIIPETMPAEKQMAEEATGVSENPDGLGRIYDSSGTHVLPAIASDLIRDGHQIEVPNAGAGSYRAVFGLLGLEVVEVLNTTSSAGDWSFVVKDGEGYYIATQTNRHPHFGFAYNLDTSRYGSLEDARDAALS